MKKTYLQNRLLKASVSGTKRLDMYIKEAAAITRKQARAMIDSGLVSVNSEKQKKYHRIIRTGDDISYDIMVKEKEIIKPYETRLDIIYHGDSMIAVNKPAGMLTHPTKFCEENTLVNALKAAYPENTIHAVNRLDRFTSGIVLAALDAKMAAELSGLILKKKVYKEYVCLVHGKINRAGIVDLNLSSGGNGAKTREVVFSGGKQANTTYEPVEIYNCVTFLRIVIKTGRTHQIRAHMKYINHPVVGDPVYGNREMDLKVFGAENAPERQLLHARLMEFVLPLDNKKYSFTAPLPEDIKLALKMAES
jgi:23S rRNA pseudouridine1911/1915/1917 synthase